MRWGKNNNPQTKQQQQQKTHHINNNLSASDLTLTQNCLNENG